MNNWKAIAILQGIQPYFVSKNEEDKNVVFAIQSGISALKAQEPKEMEICNGELYCPACGNKLKSYCHYCDECGQAVKWE